MQSKTSCFNRTVFTKTIRRFWPLWAAYALLWFLALPLSVIRAGLDGDDALEVTRMILEAAQGFSPLLCLLASILTAMAAFGWLYQSRSTAFTAALPVTRSGMFLSSAAAGAAMLLLVNMFTTLTAWVCASCTGLAVGEALGTFLAVSTLDMLCYYGFALLCTQLTGSLLILPLVYVVLLFTAVVVEVLVGYLLEHVVFGLTVGDTFLTYLSPLWARIRDCGVAAVPSETPTVTEYGSYFEPVGYRLEGWGVVALYALFGLLCTLLAWALYKRRRMESAGDTVAIAVLKPIFRWCMGVGCALCAAAGVDFLLNEGRYVPGDLPHTLLIAALLALGGLLGWFVADMLIYKSFHVFRRHGKGALLLSALLVALPLLAEVDVLGVERRVPQLGEYDTAYVQVDGEYVSISGEESFRELEKLHRAIIEHKSLHESRDVGRYTTVRIRYFQGEKLRMSRSYNVAYTPEAAARQNSDLRAAERFINLLECIQQRKTPQIPVLPETISEASLRSYFSVDGEKRGYFDEAGTPQGDTLLLTRQEAYELYTECILPDLLEGSLGRLWLVEDEDFAKTIYNLRINLDLVLLGENGQSDSYGYFYTVPTVNSHRTNAWLEEHGVKLETYWDYLQRTNSTYMLEFGPVDTEVGVEAATTWEK